MIKKIKQRIISSDLLKNTLFLTMGTVITQLISVLISPVLSRLYTPEDFGVLGKLTAFTSIFIVISSFKFDMAIVISKSAKETKHLINWSEFLIITISLIAVPVYAVIYSSTDFFILVSVFLFIFFNGNSILIISILTRYKRFLKLSYAKVFNRISSGIVQIGLGFIFNNVFGLIIGIFVGFITFFIVLSKGVSRSFFRIFKFNKNSYQDALPFLKKHYRFPLYSTPQVLLNSFSQNLPILLMDSFFGTSMIGLYWFSIKIIKIPIFAVSGSIRQTFYQKASSIRSKSELLALFIKTTKLLFLIGLPFVIVGMLISPSFFLFAFGNEWKEAGMYARWLLPWMFFAFINPPAVTLVNILNLQSFNLIYDVILVIVRLSAIYIGGTFFSAIDTIKIFSSVGILFNIFFISYIYIHVKSKISIYG